MISSHKVQDKINRFRRDFLRQKIVQTVFAQSFFMPSPLNSPKTGDKVKDGIRKGVFASRALLGNLKRRWRLLEVGLVLPLRADKGISAVKKSKSLGNNNHFLFINRVRRI